MKTISLNGREVLMYEVPVGATNIRLDAFYDHINMVVKGETCFDNLPKGNYRCAKDSWHLLGLASEIKEEQWAELVECLFERHYFDYEHPNEGGWAPGYLFDNATDSGKSLLKAQGYKEETTVILVKQ